MRRLLSLMLILIASGEFTFAPVFGKSNDSHDKAAAKIKQKIIRLGVDAPLTVKLDDDRKLNGRIGEINDDSFVIRVGASGDEQVINYSEVQQVTYAGSTGGANLGPAFLVFIAVVVVTKLLR
ncbi:MAG TPA: hypothetical protein VN743_03195 [Blastocatellia bacterium]|nr:hypothetical protein [Blastocatellia bacterium]